MRGKLGIVISSMALVGFGSAQAQQDVKTKWVDSVYQSLSQKEKVGQLFMVAAYSGGKNYNEQLITDLVSRNEIGGIIYMQGTAEAQALQTNKHQKNSKVPLLIGMDAEWGLGMRLTGVKDFPRQMMFGATRDTQQVKNMAMAIAYQCQRLGVHIDFAPVIDVNNNPNNPVINFRSFGDDKELVAQMGLAYMRGLQENGVMASAKHFPGHGDTETDSHKDLPIIKKSREQLNELEFYPFKQLIQAGVKSVMVGHMEIPALESTPKLPTTLSYNTITKTLRNDLGFKGLVFTDALNMDGVAKLFPPGEVDVKAFQAGNDVLLFSQNVPLAIDKILSALKNKQIQESQLELSVKKILAAKFDAGLNNFKPIDTTQITNDLNRYTDPIKYQTAVNAITLVRDDNKIFDLLKNKNALVRYIGVNNTGSSVFWERLKLQYPNAKASFVAKGSSQSLINNIVQDFSKNEVNIIVVHGMSFYPGVNYGLDALHLQLLQSAANQKNTIIVLNGNPYLLKNFCNANSVVVAYEDDETTQSALADVFLGKSIFKGKLPVQPCDPNFKAVAPIIAVPPVSEPVRTANPTVMKKLDAFIYDCIGNGVFPGCQIYATHNGKVILNRGYGKLSYKDNLIADTNTVYDVASITKVATTTLAVMKLYEEGKIKLNSKLVDYLPWVKGSDKANITIENLLLHQAGLKSWIPFYKNTLDSNGQLRTDLYRTKSEKGFTYQVAKDLFIKERYNDTVWDQILISPLENLGKYVYSDLDMYFLAAVVEKITGEDLEKYVDKHFYKPMGLAKTTFLPLQKIPLKQIAPTENDIIFRKQIIHGYVHDPGAAMLGGIAGHAGLFSTAKEIGAIFQMLLSKGTYQGKAYFKPSTVETFTRYQSAKSRRGYGFDKPQPSNTDAGPTGDRASSETFGHQGFTGTCVWADPATGIVFVFLSNRVHEDANNNQITKRGVRTVVQDYIYEALGYPINKNRRAGYPFK